MGHPYYPKHLEALGYVKIESNIELEDNVKVQGHWKYYDARQHKRRRCYIKKWPEPQLECWPELESRTSKT